MYFSSASLILFVAGSDRTHWLKYDENMKTRDQWAHELLNAFKDEVRTVKEAYTTPKVSPSHVPTKTEDSASPAATRGRVSSTGSSAVQNGSHGPTQTDGRPVQPTSLPVGSTGANQGQGHKAGAAAQQTLPTLNQPPPRQTKLLEACMVLRLEDFALYRVSTALDSKRRIPKKFLSSDKRALLLPQEMSSVHMELTDYYFPEGIDFPGGYLQRKN